MHHIMEVGVFSFGKVNAAVGVVIGLVVGVIYGGMMLAIGAAAGGGEGAGLGAIGAVLMIIFAPILYGGMSFIAGLIMAIVLNIVLPRVGGLELRIEKGVL